MILIAESGSSKTQWRLIDGDQVKAIVTKGINPFFADEEFIFSELNSSNEFILTKEQIKKIFFYGAGCSSLDRNQFVENVFKKYFSQASHIKVDHDMMAACIGLFGDQPGIACIVGTGSNSCVFDGKSITANVPALGYVLGDEASGAYIGKEILKNYIYKTIPKEIENYIHKEYKIDKEDIFDAIYKQPLPNRFLASFSTVASEFRSHSFIQEILIRGFQEFTDYHILCYPESKHLPIGAVGSVAFHFQEEWNQVLDKSGLKLSIINNEPIDALINYHRLS